jgi:4'-phosphopantetheinyl transferase
MSLVCKKVVSGGALLGLWKISESLEELFAAVHLSDPDRQMISKKITNQRKKESLAVRCLLNQMLDENAEITYNTDGKPFLQNSGYHISISHSDQYATIYLDKAKPIGVDIQKIKADIGKGTDFFLNDKEQLWVNKTDFILLNILWSAKESVYKYAGVKDLDPRNHISINLFETKPDGIITANIHHQNTETLLIHYEVFEDYVLTRTL